MAQINIESSQKPVPPDRFSLFELGFRPFFLMAGLAAVVLISAWVIMLASGESINSYYGLSGWHNHEMVFGFTAAVIGGFLLTAVRNWTSVQTLKGTWLALLVLLWLLARISALMPQLIPSWLIAMLDLAFIPLLALALIVPIVKANKQPQLVFVAVLTVMFAANLMVHLQILGLTNNSAESGITLAMNCVLLIIVIMAGRVLPFFTERGAPGAKPQKWPWLERLAIAVMVALMIVQLLLPMPWLIASVAAAATLIHLIRLWGWHSKLVWSVPLLWVLHLGYLWLIVGFAMTAISTASGMDSVLAVHAQAGAIAVLCLGMMARVSLGHTGRTLEAAKFMTWAFVLINLAMVARVFGPLIAADLTAQLVLLSALLWTAAFVIFLAVYIPILIRARVDGQPG